MFSIDQTKLETVTRLYNERTGNNVTADEISETINYDWSNADEHQQWLDAANEDEIASWLQDVHVA